MLEDAKFIAEVAVKLDRQQMRIAATEKELSDVKAEVGGLRNSSDVTLNLLERTDSLQESLAEVFKRVQQVASGGSSAESEAKRLRQDFDRWRKEVDSRLLRIEEERANSRQYAWSWVVPVGLVSLAIWLFVTAI